MNTNTTSSLVTLPRAGSVLVSVATALLASVPAPARSDNIYIATPLNSAVGEFTTSGATVNAMLVPGQSIPYDVEVVGNDLYVVNFNNGAAGAGSIGKYNATTGAVINASFITGLNGPVSIAVSGNDLYVSNQVSGSVGKYNATTGAIQANCANTEVDASGKQYNTY